MAGYVQVGLDVLVIAAALLVVSPTAMLIAPLGAVLLNGNRALKHRPGRHLGRARAGAKRRCRLRGRPSGSASHSADEVLERGSFPALTRDVCDLLRRLA